MNAMPTSPAHVVLSPVQKPSLASGTVRQSSNVLPAFSTPNTRSRLKGLIVQANGAASFPAQMLSLENRILSMGASHTVEALIDTLKQPPWPNVNWFPCV
jgi:hypothetical protein